MSHANHTAADNDDWQIWRVQLASGEVRMMTLDQLDAAFQEGLIDESTYVLEEGSAVWAKLGKVAGIDQPDQTPAASAYDSLPPSSGVQSIRPVVSEIADEEFAPVQFRSRKRGLVLGIAAAMVLGGLGLVTAKGLVAGGRASPPVAAAPAVLSPTTTLAALPVAAAVAKPAEVGLTLSDAVKESKLTDAQKRVLLEADKKRELAKELKDSQRKPRTPRGGSKRPAGPPVFHTGGDPHDPLNSSIAPAKK